MSNMNKNIIKGGKVSPMKKKNDSLSSPASIAEVIQLATAVAQDTMTQYHMQKGHLQVATSIQVDIIKDVLISKGLITEEEYHDKYLEIARKIQEEQQRAQEDLEKEEEEKNSNSNPSMEVSVGDIEVQKLD